MKTFVKTSIFLIIATLIASWAPPASYQIALLKYRGGGDWYANPTSLSNLIEFCNRNLKTNIDRDYATVDAGSGDIFNYPFVHMTGHGNVVFDEQEAMNLRNYMIAGGFLHIDDNYGIDPYIRPMMKKVFPELDFIELPFFTSGLPSAIQFPEWPAQDSRARRQTSTGFWTDLGRPACLLLLLTNATSAMAGKTRPCTTTLRKTDRKR
jgi:hypothetical protein